MTPHDEQILSEAETNLRRRGSALVRTKHLDCEPSEFSSAVRKLGRRNGWKMRTMLVDNGRLVAALWMDRQDTPLEEEAKERALAHSLDRMFEPAADSDTRTWEEHYEDVKRERLRVVRDDDAPGASNT